MTTVKFISGKFADREVEEVELKVVRKFLDSLLKDPDNTVLYSIDGQDALLEKLRKVLEVDSKFNSLSIKEIFGSVNYILTHSILLVDLECLEDKTNVFIIRPDKLLFYKEEELRTLLSRKNCNSTIGVMVTK